jgi:hypothetical protein
MDTSNPKIASSSSLGVPIEPWNKCAAVLTLLLEYTNRLPW